MTFATANHNGESWESIFIFVPQKGLEDTQSTWVARLLHVVVVTLLELVAGSDDSGPRPKTIAVLAKGATEVDLEPDFAQLRGLFLVGLDEMEGGRVGGLGVALLEGREHRGYRV